MTKPDRSELTKACESFARDGVAFLPGALDPQALSEAKAAWKWSLSSRSGPGSQADGHFGATSNQDHYSLEAYLAVLQTSPLKAVLSAIRGAGKAWFRYEQFARAEGGESPPTPWHRDATQVGAMGATDHFAVVSTSFDPVTPGNNLRLLRGSHRLDDGRLGAAGSDRDNLAANTATYALEPGDALIFHPAVLHARFPTEPGASRRIVAFHMYAANGVAPQDDAGRSVTSLPRIRAAARERWALDLGHRRR